MPEPSDRLGHYQIMKRLGAGAMGEVFQALDTRLERVVALKVLPEEFASSEERRRRFLQEARAASALDHPNIVTVHDVAELDGVHFVVMQYVAGETLREVLRSRRLPLSVALRFGIQIADALSEAHQKGIVHRDLKPDNVMVGADGTIKILDFGLAKILESAESSDEAPTRELVRPRTQAGLVLGTAPYMSPEQAQGDAVDARSDIFSFGAILYEMASGRRAFSGSKALSILHAVVHEEPAALGALVPTVPAELDRLVKRLLQKEPGRRAQSMADVRVALEEIVEELPRTRRRPFDASRWLGGMLALAALALAWTLSRTPDPSLAPPLRLSRVTTMRGVEAHPALSPDGRRLVFTHREEGRRDGDLYVQIVDDREPLQITRGPESDAQATWSPDGTSIAFLRTPESAFGAGVAPDAKSDVMLVSALGTGERLLTRKSPDGWGLSFSRDGKSLALIDRPEPGAFRAVYRLDLDSRSKTPLTSSPGALENDFPRDASPVFSPDGESIAFIRQFRPIQREVHVVHAGGGEPRRLTFDDALVLDVDWTPDGEYVVFSSNRDGTPKLWKVPRRGGEPVEIVLGARPGWEFTVARNAWRLVFAEPAGRSTDIWRTAGPDAEGRESAPVRLIASTAFDFAPQYAPDGARIAFVSTRSGEREIWTSDADGGNTRRLTYFETDAYQPRWSRDGSRIAFTAQVDGKMKVHVVSAAGGAPVPLSFGESGDVVPSWSRDDRFVYFASDRDGQFRVWRVPADGGAPEPVSPGAGFESIEAEDGTLFFTAPPQPAPGTGLFRMLASGEAMPVSEEVAWNAWDVLGRDVVFAVEKGSRLEVRKLDIETGASSPLFSYEGAYGHGSGGLAVSPDGRFVLYVQANPREADLSMVDDFR